MNNVAIILNYFKYFLHYPQLDNAFKYYFLTSKRRFVHDKISNLYYVNWKDYKNERFHAEGDVKSYFGFSIRVGSIPLAIDLDKLTGYYEKTFERFFENEKIDCLLSGGVTGFERIGLAVAKNIGIKSFCVWEGFFRPNTISVDPDGMNAESSIMKIPYRELTQHHCSQEYEIFFEQYCRTLHTHEGKRKRLQEIHGDKFKVIRQLRNRWKDRYDIERVKLPLRQHVYARVSYFINTRSYKTLEDISKPFIFFPLQTHTDSNVVVNAGLFPYSQYVNMVQKAFEPIAVNNGIQLIIKEHPFDVFRITYSKRENENILWVHPEISSYAILRHKQCLGCVVVNSTAGLESLILGKQVLCLGKAVYGHPELVEKSSDDSEEAITEAMTRLLSRTIDPEEVRRFCGALYDRMQVHLNIEAVPQKNDVRMFWEKIGKR